MEKWGSGAMAGLCILSVFIPIVGWIVGGINLKHPERKDQAGTLIVMGLIGAAINLFMMMG